MRRKYTENKNIWCLNIGINSLIKGLEFRPCLMEEYHDGFIDAGSVTLDHNWTFTWTDMFREFGFISENINKKFWGQLIAYLPSYHTDRFENDVSSNSSIVACVFLTAVTFLPSCFLSTIRGYTYRNTDWWEGFFNYSVEMGSAAVIYEYVPSFIKIGSGVQRLIRGDTHTHTHTHTHGQQRDLTSLLYF
jgi:hypothetical protein